MNKLVSALITRNIRFQDETKFGMGYFVRFDDLRDDFNVEAFAQEANARYDVADNGFVFYAN